MIQSVLLTAAKEDAEVVKEWLEKQKSDVIHYPLERYVPVPDDGPVTEILDKLGDFENIIYGSRRNAIYFIEKVRELDRLEEVRQRLNLTMDQRTADYLEEQGIPAIHPQVEGKAINLMEFMLRVRRMGNTLYPCGDRTKEELPGIMKELDIPVEELVLFTLEGPREEELMKFRNDLAAREPDAVIFHSRRSVTRTFAAFPQLNYDGRTVIAADRGVTGKLEEEGVEVTVQAEGSWKSVMEKFEEIQQ